MAKDNFQNEDFDDEDKPIWKKLSDKTKNISTKLKDSVDSEENFSFYAAIGYIPIIGWMIPYFGKKDNSFARFHGKQSALLSLLFITVMAIVWILNNLPILSHLLSWIGVKTFIVPAISYTAILFYVLVSGIAAYKAYQNEEWEVPFLDKVRNGLSDLFKVEKDDKPENKNNKSDFKSEI